MSSAPAVLLGAQRPTLRCLVPDHVSTAGPEAVEYAGEFGLEMDDWQSFSLDCCLAEDTEGLWAAFEFVEILARQNGKGGVIEARELAQCNVFNVDRAGRLRPQTVVHTAHELPTVEEAFERMVALIDEAPLHIRRQALTPRSGNGRWTVRWKNGSRIKYRGRSGASARGLSGDLVVFDEAMKKLDARMLAALVPILATRPNPQVLFFASAPLEESDHLRSLQLRADQGDEGLCLLEWGNQPGVDPDDREAWARANPALGIRITERFVAAERRAIPEPEFLRERLGVADAPTGARVIGAELWDALVVEGDEVERIDPVALAFDVSPDQEWGSVAAVGRRADGRWQAEVWAAQPGDDWIIDEVVAAVANRTVCRVVADPKSTAWSLVPELAVAGVEVEKVSGQELAAACAGLLSDVASASPAITHLGQPVLDAAVAAARKRPLGPGWAWHRKDISADITPLVAVTLARHGYLQAMAEGWTDEEPEPFVMFT